MKQLSVGLVIMARLKFRYHVRIGDIGHEQGRRIAVELDK